MIAGLTYIHDFLDSEEQLTLLTRLGRLSFHHDTFRGQQLKRSYAQFGHVYLATGRKLAAADPFPDFLIGLAEKARPFCIVNEPVNQCIVARYPAGAGIGWHTDARKFGGCVVGISLGGTARLQFRPNGDEEIALELLPRPGSLYSIEGPARWCYQHRVVPVKQQRYSLTLRHVPPSPDPSECEDPGTESPRELALSGELRL